MKKAICSVSLLALLSLPLAFNPKLSAFAESIEEMQLLKISPQDERAVIKTTDGKKRLLRVGDQIGDGKVIEITYGRIVIEENTATGIETVIVRLEDGVQSIERIKRVADKPPIFYKPH